MVGGGAYELLSAPCSGCWGVNLGRGGGTSLKMCVLLLGKWGRAGSFIVSPASQLPSG